nr:putative ribonuclease H-like domain-containing protein [Tanacetum cinerariifolium]
MDQQNPTLAKIPILDTGKFEQWQFQIPQYLQHEHYALWEVIEFGDSYKAPKEDAATTSDGSAKKKGRTVTVTTEDMQKRKNDVKARTTFLLGNEATKKTKKNLLKQQYGNFKVEGTKTLEHTFNRLQSGSRMAYAHDSKHSSGNEEVNTASTNVSPASANIGAIDEDDMEEMDIKWNMAFLSMRADRQGSKVEEQTPKALMEWDGTGASWRMNKRIMPWLLMKKLLQICLDECETGIPKFVDDTVTYYSRPSPAIESTSDDVQNRNSYETEASSSTISSKPFIKFMKATVRPTENKTVNVELIKKPVVKYAEQYKKPSKKSTDRGNQRNWNNLKSQQLGENFEMKNKACFYCGHFDHLSYDCGLGVKKRRSYPKNNCSNKMRSQYRAPWVPTVNRNVPTVNRKFPTVNRKFPTGSTKFSTANNRKRGNAVKASAFTWTFFFKTKDETSGILKKFITEIENLKDLKVKIIRYKRCSSQEVKKDVSSLRYIALPNWVHDAILVSSSSKPQDDCSTDVPKSSENSNPTATSTSPPADQIETLTVETPIPTVSSPVPTTCFTDSQEPSSDTRFISKRVANQVETPSLDNILTLTNQFEDILGVTKNSVDSDGVEADVSNMETTLTARVRPIGTKWVIKNKKDERGIVIRNKARLVAQGHVQKEGIDYDEVFAPVARIEAIRLYLAYASFMGFTVYQMNVKSAFLYGTIDEEVYVMQPPRFQDPEFPARVYKVEKSMYGLHQAPRAWYGTLSKYLLTNGFQRGDFILVQVYVDDIIFGSSNPQLCREFEDLMHEKFQMSAMGELNFFLGLQVLQKEDGIFLSQDKYVGDIFKKFRYSDVRSSNTPMDKENPWGKDETGKDVDLHLYRSMIGSLMYLTASRPDIMFVICTCARHQVTPKECHLHALHAVKRIFRYLKGHPKLRLWYPKESPFDLVAYSDSDYGGATQDRKSTTGECQFLGRRLISWQCKKQTIVATSTTEAEYVAAASCCGQVLWIQNQLLDYGLSMPYEALSKEISSSILLMQYTRRTRIAQSLVLLLVADEPASPFGDDSQGEAFPIDSSFEAYQDRENIAKTSTLPSDSTPRVTSLAADEGSMKQKLDELTALCTSLQRQQSAMVSKFEAQELEINSLKVRIKLLEDKDRRVAEQSGDDAPIKERRLDEEEEAAERVSDDTEEMATVLTSMDAARILTSGGVQVVPTGAEVATATVSIPTGSGVVSTASPTIPTAAPIFTTAIESTPYTRRKGKEIMVESETPKKKKVQEQIDVQLARELEEEMARDTQRMNEQIARDA